MNKNSNTFYMLSYDSDNEEYKYEYICKYFACGKRYYAKRNNFKVLFRTYILFIGKLMKLYNK